MYNVREDPTEWNNLAGEAGYEAVKAELRTFMPETERTRPGATASSA